MRVFECKQGASSLILAFPHTGTDMPSSVADRLNENGKLLSDTDWHLHKLYEGLAPDATTLRALFHRYVIDANRDPLGNSLYPGRNTTGLVPLTDFDGQTIWNEPPETAEIETRLSTYHAPYHMRLQNEIDRVKALHGFAVVFDCHSIRSHIPFLFEGSLPDFNIGTNGGYTCHFAVERAALDVAEKAADYTHVLNGRFKGGWTTRHYGKPEQNVHAIQIELAQSTYLETECAPFAYDDKKANKLRVHLKAMLQAITHAMTGSVQ
jgi:N-formylglutamate deformylase